MKNRGLLIGASALLILIVGCAKDNSSTDFAVINQEKLNIENALKKSEAYNDTLIMVYDTVFNRHLNSTCIKYDELYHQEDSMFSMHYSMFGDEMYKNNVMMPYYTPSSEMMNGGMMGSESMDMRQLQEDTARVNEFYTEMLHLRNTHQIYHNGIFN